MKNIKSFEQLNEGTMISKRNMDLDEFKSQGSFFNREPHSNDSPVHGKSLSELNEERAGDLEREITNVIERYKTKMNTKEIFDVLNTLKIKISDSKPKQHNDYTGNKYNTSKHF